MLFNTIFNKGHLPVLELAINFTGQRHKVITNNIANATTPKYKALDLPVSQFQTELARAIDEMERRPVRLLDFEGSPDVTVGPGNHIEPTVVQSAGAGMMRHDENNVAIEMQMVELAKNTGLNTAFKEILAQQYNLLDMAISLRVT
ncbi:MAG: flagellar basal body rod protein FlgB [Planctomycetota bacterium]|nr:flagellar basal body rod protein FlgB [Planctomycetota bacterium]